MQTGSERSRGQTLVIVLIIMFVLVTLGFVVVIILGREIGATGFARQRNLANELSQAGVRYAFAQLRFSEEGADWRPEPAAPIPADVNMALPPGLGPSSDPENTLNVPATQWRPDPDYFWLRRQVIPNNPNPDDRGGPDGLGAFTRLNYDEGRTLVRVRYSPSGQELFDQNVQLTEKGKLRSYTIVESVGRPGAFNFLDPTSTREPNLQNAKELVAIVPIGLIETAYYVHNKDERNQPVDFGIPEDFGSNYLGNPVKVRKIQGGDVVQRPGGANLTLGGPMYVNGDLRLFGNVLDPNGASGAEIYLNADLGDQINVAGQILFADPAASPLRVYRVSGLTTTNFLVSQSANPNFSTGGGVVRDSSETPDPNRFPRDIRRKEPPLIDETDPNTGQIRYRLATRDSGVIGPSGFNIGRLGHGRGIYINNNNDFNRDSEDGNYTQRYDLLNPNAHPAGFWTGPFYIPPAVHILLLSDGFLISRNIKNSRDTWRDFTGADTGRHTLRFKLGQGSGNPADIRVISELTPNVTNFGNPTQADFSQGVPFNGLIYCEGNVRIRGVIPAVQTSAGPRGIQLTVVSMGTGYVEGSIIKGNPETSLLALLCRDNVVLNTSQFVGSSVSNTLQVVRDNDNPTSPARLRVDTSHNFDMWVQFPNDPVTGNSFLASYLYTNPNRGAGNPVQPSVFIAEAAEFNQSTFFNLLINEDTAGTPSFLFENTNPPNAAAQFFPPGNPIPTYGLADPSFQVLPLFERRRYEFFPIQNNVNGAYTLFTGGSENVFRFKLDNTISNPGRGDYFFSRMTVQPLDVRIEAAMYAQEGSFIVVPGPWFNPNPNDRRDSYTNASNRFAAFQATPDYPFYAEPVDIRVTIVGSVSENFPLVMADQMQWLQHWGWIPAQYGASGQYVPDQHFPRQPGTGLPDFSNSRYVPNLYINYDPVLISGRVGGSFQPNVATIRTDRYGRPLPPMPKLPVGTRLMYFGEVNP